MELSICENAVDRPLEQPFRERVDGVEFQCFVFVYFDDCCQAILPLGSFHPSLVEGGGIRAKNSEQGQAQSRTRGMSRGKAKNVY